MKYLKILTVLLCVIMLSGCFKDESFSKAYCNNKEYNIISITRWSDSNYVLKLQDGSTIEVHPMNCYFTE